MIKHEVWMWSVLLMCLWLVGQVEPRLPPIPPASSLESRAISPVSLSSVSMDPKVLACLVAYAPVLEPEDWVHYQMLDYTGKAIDDMGNYDGCQALPATAAHYCVAQTLLAVGKANAHISIYMGVCAPIECNGTTIRDLIVAGLLSPRFNLTTKYPIAGEVQSLSVHCIPRPEEAVHLTPGAIITIVIFGIILLLVIGGTLLEYAEAQFAASKEAIFVEEKKALLDEPSDEDKRLSLANAHLMSPPHTPLININEEHIPEKKQRKFKLHLEILRCFAVGANLRFLLKDNRASELGLAPLNGLRCLMMAWVILGHTFTYLNTPVGFDNSITLTQHVIERVSFQVVPAAELAVDVFFYLSGFLVVYMVLKEMKSRKGKPFPWGLFYFHRYWRLTPVYGLIILFYTTVTPFLIYGPFSYLYRGMKTDLCDKYWWSNLLYINNFYPTDSNVQCFGWGWYLANDMQFFMLTPIVIVLFKKSRNLAWALILVLITVCLTLDGVLTYHNHLLPLNPGDAKWNTIVYNKPYTRMAPYLVGIAAAFLAQYDVDFSKNHVVRWTGYILGATATTCSTYLTYGFWRGDGWEVWQNVLYATGARFSFVMGVAWFMYACFRGHGGILRAILSVYMWVPISRLTYTAYLTHPIIMFVINYSATTNFHYSAIYAGVRYSSHITLAYVTGLVFHLAIEKPTANLERLMLPQKRH